MKAETLKKARELESLIWYAEQGLESLKVVIEDFDNFGSSLQFKRNKDDVTKSFGSKKFNFKKELLPILNNMFLETSKELESLKTELEYL